MAKVSKPKTTFTITVVTEDQADLALSYLEGRVVGQIKHFLGQGGKTTVTIKQNGKAVPKH